MGERILTGKSMTEESSSRAHLLVVDDARIRSMMARYLEGEGFRVSLAENGNQMRQSLTASAVDLILLDLGLPDGNGLDLARELRAQSEVGIIIVTGRTDDVDRIVGLDCDQPQSCWLNPCRQDP